MTVLEYASVPTHIDGKTHKKRSANAANGEHRRWIEPEFYAEGISYSTNGTNDELECFYCDTLLRYVDVQNHIITKAHGKKRDAGRQTQNGGYVPRNLSDEGIHCSENGQLMCTICSAGPFVGPEVAAKHIEGAKHQKKKKAAAVVLTPNMEQNRIRLEDPGMFYCEPCSKKFSSEEQVNNHIKSDKHIKHLLTPAKKEGAKEAQASEVLEEDFVPDAMPVCLSVFEGDYWCDHCMVKVGAEGAKAHTEKPAHKKKEAASRQLSDLRFPPCCSLLRKRCNACDAQFETRRELVLHLGSKEHNRNSSTHLEYDSKLGFLRDDKGQKYTRNGHFKEEWANPLPPMWHGYVDEKTDKAYFHNVSTKVTTWEDPRTNVVLASLC
eukprot:GEMP01028802.1.p1 GENE.GEMP01028802.1~~GEMP01028802.1.p1  ORF type:complete len:380 (+),score=88.14 GEMP01028802.1:531-1670(+)